MKRKTRRNKERTAEYVYSLPTPTAGSDVNTATDDEAMMEDGPVPMKNLKPSQKNPNGKDNFLQEHKTEYDAHGKPTEQIRRVETHNNACPKLIDELNKKRSTAKVTVRSRNVGATQTLPNSEPTYTKRVKLRKAQKRNDSKFVSPMKRKHREKRSRVTKFKRSQPRRINNDLTIKTNKSVQHFPYTMNMGTSPEKQDYLPPLLFKMAAENPNPTSQNNNEPLAKKSRVSLISSRNAIKSQDSIRSKKYPDTSDPSMSSYNSYQSMDHEPMV